MNVRSCALPLRIYDRSLAISLPWRVGWRCELLRSSKRSLSPAHSLERPCSHSASAPWFFAVTCTVVSRLVILLDLMEILFLVSDFEGVGLLRARGW